MSTLREASALAGLVFADDDMEDIYESMAHRIFSGTASPEDERDLPEHIRAQYGSGLKQETVVSLSPALAQLAPIDKPYESSDDSEDDASPVLSQSSDEETIFNRVDKQPYEGLYFSISDTSEWMMFIFPEDSVHKYCVRQVGKQNCTYGFSTNAGANAMKQYLLGHVNFQSSGVMPAHLRIELKPIPWEKRITKKHYRWHFQCTSQPHYGSSPLLRVVNLQGNEEYNHLLLPPHNMNNVDTRKALKTMSPITTQPYILWDRHWSMKPITSTPRNTAPIAKSENPTVMRPRNMADGSKEDQNILAALFANAASKCNISSLDAVDSSPCHEDNDWSHTYQCHLCAGVTILSEEESENHFHEHMTDIMCEAPDDRRCPTCGIHLYYFDDPFSAAGLNHIMWCFEDPVGAEEFVESHDPSQTEEPLEIEAPVKDEEVVDVDAPIPCEIIEDGCLFCGVNIKVLSEGERRTHVLACSTSNNAVSCPICSMSIADLDDDKLYEHLEDCRLIQLLYADDEDALSSELSDSLLALATGDDESSYSSPPTSPPRSNTEDLTSLCQKEPSATPISTLYNANNATDTLPLMTTEPPASSSGPCQPQIPTITITPPPELEDKGWNTQPKFCPEQNALSPPARLFKVKRARKAGRAAAREYRGRMDGKYKAMRGMLRAGCVLSEDVGNAYYMECIEAFEREMRVFEEYGATRDLFTHEDEEMQPRCREFDAFNGQQQVCEILEECRADFFVVTDGGNLTLICADAHDFTKLGRDHKEPDFSWLLERFDEGVSGSEELARVLFAVKNISLYLYFITLAPIRLPKTGVQAQQLDTTPTLARTQAYPRDLHLLGRSDVLTNSDVCLPPPNVAHQATPRPPPQSSHGVIVVSQPSNPTESTRRGENSCSHPCSRFYKQHTVLTAQRPLPPLNFAAVLRRLSKQLHSGDCASLCRSANVTSPSASPSTPIPRHPVPKAATKTKTPSLIHNLQKRQHAAVLEPVTDRVDVETVDETPSLQSAVEESGGNEEKYGKRAGLWETVKGWVGFASFGA